MNLPLAPSSLGVVVVGHGSREPAANAELEALVAAWSATRPGRAVSLGYVELARPLVDDTLERVARSRPERIVVVPYFLTAGRLVDKLRAQLEAFAARYPWIQLRLAAHLGAADPLFAVMDERIRELLEGAGPLAC